LSSRVAEDAIKIDENTTELEKRAREIESATELQNKLEADLKFLEEQYQKASEEAKALATNEEILNNTIKEMEDKLILNDETFKLAQVSNNINANQHFT
jgi:septal ring factor EnvC (AmiA/AmiB activator)